MSILVLYINYFIPNMKKMLWTSENYYKEKTKKLQIVVCIKK